MWKASLAGVVALLTLGASLACGQTNRTDTDEPAAGTQQRTPARADPASPGNPPPTEPVRPVALVIGNGAYPDAESKLVQPVDSARALTDALKSNGFDVVSGENLGKQEMHRAIEAFTNKVTPGSTALIYF